MSKRRPKKKALDVVVPVGTTPERRRQNGGVIIETATHHNDCKTRAKRYRSTAECMLDAYRWHGKISDKEHAAGMKFRRAYLRAVLRVKVEDQGSGSRCDYDMSGLMVPISEQILKQAYSVLSTAQKALIVRVCGDDTPAGDSYRLETLKRGLAQLIQLWKIA